MKLRVTLDWRKRSYLVGYLEVSQARAQERYRFNYAPEWVKDKRGFAIDPGLELSTHMVYHSATLWGVFKDISPDRWGRLVQNRVHPAYLSESDYMLGVSDLMRMGALRLSRETDPQIFLATHREVPKLVHLRALERAVQRLEIGKETEADLAILAHPGSSLGGAHPKAAIEDQDTLWIAKFQSRHDDERVGLWEALMLDLAQQAGINTAPFRILNIDSDRPVFLTQRFDRDVWERVPYMSAMTMLERDESNHDSASYLEISDAICRYSSQPLQDKQALWRRMVFNMLFGNIDDHLRNHGFLRDEQGWYLSPAFDLNPNNQSYERRAHALSFDGQHQQPSLALGCELAAYFDIDQDQQQTILADFANTLARWRQTARRWGLSDSEIKRIAPAFEHADQEKILATA